MDESRPHKCVMLINIEVHEVLPTGECSGDIMTNEELKKYGVKRVLTKSIDGFDRFECMKKLNAILAQF